MEYIYPVKNTTKRIDPKTVTQYENDDFPSFIFRNKWFDSDYYLNIFETAYILYFYPEDLFIRSDNGMKRMKISFLSSYSEIIDKISEKNILSVNLNFYEMGNNIHGIETLRNELLSVIIIPLKYIERNGSDFFLKENFFTIYSKIDKKKLCRKRTCVRIVYPEKSEYFRNYDKCRRYILHGYTYQINYTERLFLESDERPYEIFRKAYENFNSYLSYFTVNPDRILVSDSPERLFRLSGNIISTNPIKGTISTKIEDYREKLLGSRKDLCELAMITDLLRNDICSLIKTDSLHVRFPILMELNEIAHIYSLVSGEIKKSITLSDIIGKVYPGGSVTGVPKRMTMKIIDHLERCPREIYTGSLGIIKSKEEIDYNILIRSFYYRKGKYLYGAGGGITVNSIREDEWDELILKTGKIRMLHISDIK